MRRPIPSHGKKAAVDDTGDIVGRGDMEPQMRQAYANIRKVLEQYRTTMDSIVDEVLFVTGMDARLRSGG
jgi:2-iminobutanoate/2-iminopropanoate deaminase